MIFDVFDTYEYFQDAVVGVFEIIKNDDFWWFLEVFETF